MEKKNLGFLGLIAVVLGSMIGSGVFVLPSDMARNASPQALLLGWLITGVGIISLVFVFQNLTQKKPHLTGGIYTYAAEGFGRYAGFLSAWGYWIANILANISYLLLMFKTLSYFFPSLNVPAFQALIGPLIVLSIVTVAVLRGMKNGVAINIILTLAKLIPLFVLVVVLLFVFNLDKLSFNFSNGSHMEFGSVLQQVRGIMLVTLWAFLGIEGAVVLSGRAKNVKDVSKATLYGLLGILVLYLCVSFLPLAVIDQSAVAGYGAPSTAFVLKYVLGDIGFDIVNIGLIISVAGAYLSWTLLCVEISYISASKGVFPKRLARENAKGVPVGAISVTTVITVLGLLIAYVSKETSNIAYSLATTTYLLPYALCAGYGIKVAFDGDKVQQKIYAIIALVFSFWMLYGAGMSYLLVSILIYFPATLIFVFSVWQNEGKVFLSKKEKIFIILFAIVSLYALYSIIEGVVHL